MELSDSPVAVCQMKDEWRFVFLVNGKLFVATTGVRMKREWCVGNSDTPLKVIVIILVCTAHQ